jgi:hypothetical protein
MSSFEKFRKSLSCPICNLVYKQPVKLPCGKTICKCHLQDSNKSLLNCTFCHLEQKTPSNGFYPNFFIQSQIKQNKHLNEKEIHLKSKIEQSLQNLENSHDEFNEVEKYTREYFTSVQNEILQCKN